MRSKIFALCIGVMIVLSCRKSNYTPPVTPVLPDSLMNWNVISTLSGTALSDIWFTSVSRGFALGDKIYQTLDGGSSWAEVPNASGASHFFNLFFVNSKIGFAQGFSQIAITVDGGDSWMVKSLPTTTGYTIFFAVPSVGFFGDIGGLEKTTDTGNSWVTNFSDSGIQKNYYPYFLNSDTGFVVTGSGKCASTSDGGQTWQIRTTNLPPNQIPQIYNQLFFLDMYNGFYACPTGVMKTSDGGQSWQHVLLDSVD
ncbi:MAG TPA: YCF48-related protein, partial [Puia sp.]